jgi:MFS family permease
MVNRSIEASMNMLMRARAFRQARRGTRPGAVPGAPLSPSAVQRGLRLSIVEGSLSNIHITVTGGAFLTGFALLLGASDFELGLLAALPFVGQLFQFVGAYLEERLGERRRLCALTAGASRSLWAVMAALPFLSTLGASRLPIFLLILAISQALIGITVNAWLSWMSDLVPPRQRGRYFGTRNTITSITAMAASWLAGRALDSYRGAGAESVGYALIFCIASMCAVAGAMVLWRQPEPPMRRVERVRVRQLLSAPLRHRPFRMFSLTAAAWALVIGIGGPFFNAYGIQNLKLSFASLAVLAIITSAVALGTQPLIGRLQDRYGDKRVLVGSVIGVVLLPWGWVLSTPDFLLPLWLNAILSGVFWPGINQGLMNLLMDRAPAEGRGAYVASYGAITGFGTFLASLLGGAIATGLASTVVQIGPLALNHYAILFVASSLGRAAMAFVFARRL